MLPKTGKDLFLRFLFSLSSVFRYLCEWLLSGVNFPPTVAAPATPTSANALYKRCFLFLARLAVLGIKVRPLSCQDSCW